MKTFKYDASDFSLVQAWIYTKDLNKGTISQEEYMKLLNHILEGKKLSN